MSDKIIWKDVYGMEDYFEVNTIGAVRSKTRTCPMPNGGFKKIGGNVLKGKVDRYGYMQYHLRVNRKSYHRTGHRLVAIAFLGLEKKLQVNHMDGNKLNNNVSNLEWVTSKENISHSIDTGLRKKLDQNGELNHMSKLTEKDVFDIREMLHSNVKQIVIADIFGVSRSCISSIKKNQTWKHL